MTDDRDSYRVEPDAEFANRLERVLLRRLAAPAGSSTDASTGQDLTAIDVDHSGDGIDAVGRRRIDMALVDTEPAPSEPTRRRRWPIAAAAALVAVVVGGIVLAARDDADDPQIPAAPNTTAAPGPPAEDQAAGLARAMLIWRYEDPDEAMRHLTDELIAEAADGTREGYRLEGRMLNALGERNVNIRCAPAGESAGGIDVQCTFDTHTFRSEERGLPPFPDSQTVAVRDDTIVAFGEFDVPPYGAQGHFTQMWHEFKQWVTAEYPDDVPVMYEGSGWRLTEESIALWERRTIEWAGEQARARVGFIGLPPEGATPSTPETGELVVYRYARSRLLVYADGRLIWQQPSYLAEGANPRSTGYLEQRLTPEGVELIRSEVLASGLFDEDLNLIADDDAGPCGILMRVPDGERLVKVFYGCPDQAGPDSQAATENQTNAILRLNERLADLQSWLPASGWQDQTIRAYVPSGFGICLHPSDPNETGPITTVDVESTPQPDRGQLIEQLLNLLPAPAAEVLRGSETVPSLDGSEEQCLVVTTDEARLLDQALNDVGAELDQVAALAVLAYHVDYPGQDGAGVGIVFEPRFPDGSINCSTCG